MFCTLTSKAFDFKVDGIYYAITSENTCEVTFDGFLNDSNFPIGNHYTGNVAIPSTVTHQSTLYNVTSIGKQAFYRCENLSKVTIPESITEIGEMAFTFCGSLESIFIPKSIVKIGEAAFTDCRSLTEFNIDDANEAYKTIDGVLFTSDMSHLIAYPIGRADTHYDIPESVLYVDMTAFAYDTHLISVDLPLSLREIGKGAFQYSVIESMIMSDGIVCIREQAFRSCNKLKEIRLSYNLNTMDKGAFYQCKKLKEIHLPAKLKNLESGIFRECTSLEKAYFEEGMNVIPQQIFRDCSALSYVYIPKSIESIEPYAFEGCSNLNTIINEALIPQKIDKTSFTHYGNLYVPTESITMYKTTNIWKNFNIQSVTSVNTIFKSLDTDAIYNLDGTKHNGRSHGIKIIISKDGKTAKTLK